ncbi:AI-2E family transporter [Candidatus Woesearchaeota archaeon]|nr:AI-2E family transporter [Candidatus Woesearchaeota archaeon]
MLLIAVLTLSFFMIMPFLTAILTSLILTYIFYPVYKKVNKKIKNKNLASFIVTILILVLIILPSFLILNTASKEARSLYEFSKETFFAGKECDIESKEMTCQIKSRIEEFLSIPQVKLQVASSVNKAPNFLVEQLLRFIFSIPKIVLNFFIIFFVVFFLLRDEKTFVDKIGNLLPLKKEQKKHIFKRFNDVAFAVIYGSIIVAIIQGTVAGIGYYFAGIRSPLIWALITMFFALVPLVGTAVVWLPASLVLIFSGYATSNTLLIVKGVLLLLYGALIVSTIDNLLKPKIIGERAKVHPVIVLLGVLGGLSFFGFIGFIVGPIILGLAVAFIKIYEEEKYF